MHGQRSCATRVDERGEASNSTTPPAARAPLLKRGGETRPPRPLRGHPSSREEGKLDHPARCAATPPQERRGNSTTAKSGYPAKSDHPARCAGTPPQERRGRPHDRFCGVCLRIAARISSMALSISSSVRSLWSALLKSSSCVVTPSRFSVRGDTSPAIAPGCVSAQVIATTERLSESAPP